MVTQGKGTTDYWISWSTCGCAVKAGPSIIFFVGQLALKRNSKHVIHHQPAFYIYKFKLVIRKFNSSQFLLDNFRIYRNKGSTIKNVTEKEMT